ncbi:hypothetical protein PENSPDRAFT_597526 [Peniophora sp. CONT]|nr:hypothetical protein PENSPDRAFT_597526 [Peniophora sp. CONT]
MPAPPIQVFLTTIASQPALRQRQEYILRILQTKQIPFDSYDLASDEQAKSLWRRKAPVDKQQLPGILVGGTCPGTFAQFEEAVEFDELDVFLRRNDSWDPEIDELRPAPPVKPIGVPGAASPSQMAKPEHKRYFTPSPQPSPLKGKAGERSASNALKPNDPGYQAMVDELHRRNEQEFDVSEELSGYGLQGVKVTEDDLLALVEELGLGGEEAGSLARGLSASATSTKAAIKATDSKPSTPTTPSGSTKGLKPSGSTKALKPSGSTKSLRPSGNTDTKKVADSASSKPVPEPKAPEPPVPVVVEDAPAKAAPAEDVKPKADLTPAKGSLAVKGEADEESVKGLSYLTDSSSIAESRPSVSSTSDHVKTDAVPETPKPSSSNAAAEPLTPKPFSNATFEQPVTPTIMPNTDVGRMEAPHEEGAEAMSFDEKAHSSVPAHVAQGAGQTADQGTASPLSAPRKETDRAMKGEEPGYASPNEKTRAMDEDAVELAVEMKQAGCECIIC